MIMMKSRCLEPKKICSTLILTFEPMQGWKQTAAPVGPQRAIPINPGKITNGKRKTKRSKASGKTWLPCKIFKFWISILAGPSFHTEAVYSRDNGER